MFDIFRSININCCLYLGKEITLLESTILALKNKHITDIPKEDNEKHSEKKDAEFDNSEKNTETEQKHPEGESRWRLELFEKKEETAHDQQEKKEPENTSVKDVQRLKLQRSLSQPAPLSQLTKIQKRRTFASLKSEATNYNENDSETLASDVYMYSLPWACCAMVFWKNVSLIPLLPLPLLIYLLKHIGFYLGIWQWLGGYLEFLIKCVSQWCQERIDALIPVPVRGLYRATLKINKVIKDNAKDSIDTVSSIVVILGLIIFVLCASVFFAIQVRLIILFKNIYTGCPR